MAAFALLEAEAERVVAHDRARAAGLLTQAGVALVAHGSMDRLAALAERALALALRRKPSSCRPCCTPRRWRRSASTPAPERSCGAATRRCERSTRPALATRSSRSRRSSTCGWRTTRTPSGCSCGSIETCRERGAIVALAFPLAVAASLHLRRGSFSEAARLSDEARRARRGRRRQLPALGHADHGGVRCREPRRGRGVHPVRRAGARDRAAPGPDLDAGMRRAGARVPRARRRRRGDGRRPPRARARAHPALRLARPVVPVHAGGSRGGLRARRSARPTPRR